MPETPDRQTLTTDMRYDMFVAAFLANDGDGTKAYMECGAYKPSSRKAAQSAASRLLSNDIVRKKIAKAANSRKTRLKLDADLVVLEQLRLAQSDIRDTMTWERFTLPMTGMVIKGSDELTDDEAAAIAEFQYTAHPTSGLKFKIKLHDKAAALDKVMRHLGLYERDNKRTIELDGELKEARAAVSDAISIMAERMATHSTNGTNEKHAEH